MTLPQNNKYVQCTCLLKSMAMLKTSQGKVQGRAQNLITYIQILQCYHIPRCPTITNTSFKEGQR